VGGGQSGHAPFQSYAVANTATYLFEAISEHDKMFKTTENISAEILHMIAKMLSASGSFASLTRGSAPGPCWGLLRSPCPPPSSFWICQCCYLLQTKAKFKTQTV